MDTRQIEYILTIAEEQSISKAAERLFISQSALSQQLAKLKEEGLPPLFFHNKGKMLLTDAGKIYINGVRNILNICMDTEEALNTLNHFQVPKLQVAVSPRLKHLFYTEMLPWLRHTYPDTEVNVFSAREGKTVHELEERELDLAIYCVPHLHIDRLEYSVLRCEELVICTGKGYIENELPLILPAKGTHLYSICYQVIAKYGMSNAIYAQVDNPLECSSLLSNGECATLLPLRDILKADLVIKALEPIAEFYTVAAYRKENLNPFISSIIQQFKTLLSREI